MGENFENFLSRFEKLIERFEKVAERLEESMNTLEMRVSQTYSDFAPNYFKPKRVCDGDEDLDEDEENTNDESIDENENVPFISSNPCNRNPDDDLMEAIVAENSNYQIDQTKWHLHPESAQYGGASWDSEITRVRKVPLSECFRIADADPRITFFFYNARGNLYLSNHDPDHPDKDTELFDAVFFSGKAWFGSAPQSDAYVKQIFGKDAWEM